MFAMIVTTFTRQKKRDRLRFCGCRTANNRTNDERCGPRHCAGIYHFVDWGGRVHARIATDPRGYELHISLLVKARYGVFARSLSSRSTPSIRSPTAIMSNSSQEA